MQKDHHLSMDSHLQGRSTLLGLWRSEVLASPMGFLACVLALLGRRANIAAPRRKVAQVILWTSIRVPVGLVVAVIHVVEVALHQLPLLPFTASLVQATMELLFLTAILALLFIALRRVTRLCIEARDLQSALLGLWRSEVLASPVGFLACVLALLGRPM